MAKLSYNWSGLLAKLLTIYPPFQERSGQAVRQMEWATSQATLYLSLLFRREVAKLSDEWNGLLAKLLTIYPPFQERSGQAVRQMEWLLAKLLSIYPFCSGEKWPSCLMSGMGY